MSRRLTSNLGRDLGILLDFLLREHAQHDHVLHALLEPLVAQLQGLGVDEPAVDLGPARARRDALLAGILQRRDPLADRRRVLRELLARGAQDALGLRRLEALLGLLRRTDHAQVRRAVVAGPAVLVLGRVRLVVVVAAAAGAASLVAAGITIPALARAPVVLGVDVVLAHRDAGVAAPALVLFAQLTAVPAPFAPLLVRLVAASAALGYVGGTVAVRFPRRGEVAVAVALVLVAPAASLAIGHETRSRSAGRTERSAWLEMVVVMLAVFVSKIFVLAATLTVLVLMPASTIGVWMRIAIGRAFAVLAMGPERTIGRPMSGLFTAPIGALICA